MLHGAIIGCATNLVPTGMGKEPGNEVSVLHDVIGSCNFKKMVAIAAKFRAEFYFNQLQLVSKDFGHRRGCYAMQWLAQWRCETSCTKNCLLYHRLKTLVFFLYKY